MPASTQAQSTRCVQIEVGRPRILIMASAILPRTVRRAPLRGLRERIHRPVAGNRIRPDATEGL